MKKVMSKVKREGDSPLLLRSKICKEVVVVGVVGGSQKP